MASEPVRDNKSYRVLPGVELSPDALPKGSAKVRCRQFTMTSSPIPEFRRVVADASISYVLLGRTRFTTGLNREVPVFSRDRATLAAQ